MNLQSRELLNFLKKQNSMQKQDIKQLKQLLSLNREALLVSIKCKQQKDQRALPQLVRLLYQQNSQLHQKVYSLKNQIQSNLCQALISQQIAFASTQQQVYLTSQLKQRLSKLKKQLQLKQKQILQIQKWNKNADIFVIQYTQLNKLTQSFKSSICKLNQQIDDQKQELAKIKEQKEELIKLNLILTKQVNEMKFISCQTTKSNQPNTQEMRQNTLNELGKYLKYQKKLSDQDDSNSQCNDNQSQGSNISSSSASNVQQKEQEYQKSVAEVSRIQKLSKTKMSIIPKLQLTKAKQIQNLIVKKINNDQKKKKQSGGQVKSEKYQKLQEQVQNLRKKLGAEILLKLQIERESSFLKRFIKQLEDRNQLLVGQSLSSQAQENYKINRQKHEQGNVQTLLDICRDVTLNEKLRNVVSGRQKLKKLQVISFEI